MNEDAPRDGNFVPTAIFQIDGEARGQLMAGQIDQSTGRVLVDMGGTTGGDVVGPASSTDNAIVRFDGTTGKLIQNSGVIIDDSDNLTFSGGGTISGSSGSITLTASGSAQTINLVPGSNTSVQVSTNIAAARGLAVSNANSNNMARARLSVDANAGGTVIDTTSSSFTTSGVFVADAGYIYSNTSLSGGFGVGSAAAAPLVFFTNQTEVGRFLSGGNFGINQSTPLAKLHVTNTTDAASNQAAIFESDRATPAANDEVYVSFKLSDSAGNQDEFARIITQGTDVTSGSEDGRLQFAWRENGTLTTKLEFESTRIRPATGQSLDIGSGSAPFANAFLGSGGVINWANGNFTLTHSTGVLTYSGVLAGSQLRASGSGGVEIENSSGTDVAIFGAGAGTGTSLLGTTNVGSSSADYHQLAGGTGTITDTATGSSTDININLVPKGTGRLQTNAVNVPTISSTDTLTNKILSHTVEPGTDDTFTGEQLTGFNATATIAQWESVYLSTTGWALTDADAAATAGGVMVGLAAAAGTNGNPLTVVTKGVVRNDGWTWTTVGAPLYLSTTAGALTETAPSGTDDVVRIVGYVMSDDCIFFNPSNDWITRV